MTRPPTVPTELTDMQRLCVAQTARANRSMQASIGYALDAEIAALCDAAAAWLADIAECVRVAMAPIFAALANTLQVAAERSIAGYRGTARSRRTARAAGFASGAVKPTHRAETVTQRTHREAVAFGMVRS